MLEFEFGYLPEKLDVSFNSVEIATLPQFDEVVASVGSNPNVRQKWFYPGAQQWLSSARKEITEDPFTVRVFGMPMTHRISASPTIEREYLEFVLWVLSFIKGMRLTGFRQGFLDTTPIELHALVDFTAIGDATAPLNLAERFWASSQSEPVQRKRLCAAIHSMFISCNPRLMDFEKFLFLYSALDTCFAMMRGRNPGKQEVSHAGRIDWMCKQFNLPVPPWATLRPDPSGRPNKLETEISALRNDTIHEAMYAGEPFGFAFEPQFSNRNLPYEMRCIACRILAALLGVSDTEYLNSGTDHYGRRLMRV